MKPTKTTKPTAHRNPTTVTKEYIKLLENTEEKITGKKKAMVLAIVTAIQDDKPSLANQLRDTLNMLKKYDEDKGTRTHRNIITLINRGLKKRVAMQKLIEDTDLSAFTMDDMLNLNPDKKETEKETEKGDDKTPDKVVKSHGVTSGTSEEKVDVKEEVKAVKDEIITRASEISKSNSEDLVDKYLENALVLEELIDSFDPNKSKAITATSIAIMEKLISTLQA